MDAELFPRARTEVTPGAVHVPDRLPGCDTTLVRGDTCVFRRGATEPRTQPYTDIALPSGELFAVGGPARLTHHGVRRVLAGTAPPEPGLTGRLDITLRVSGR